MGDQVNLASRLEGANTAFGSVIMIGSRTYEEAKAGIVAKPLARIVVVGRSRPEPVYELLAMRENATAETVAHAEAFARAQDAAKRGDLAAACAALDEAERHRPGDGPVAWFRGLLDRMEAGEVATPWSGVVELTAK
jgi:adenylate cyclase